MRTYQVQVNFAIHLTTTAVGISLQHINQDLELLKSLYRFHIYYGVRRVLHRLDVRLPYERGFEHFNNSYSREAYLKLCAEYKVDPASNFGYDRLYSHYADWLVWHIGKEYPNNWIMPTSKGLTSVDLHTFLESVHEYVYLLLISQSEARGSILGNSAAAMNAGRIYLNFLEDVISKPLGIGEDIKRYQNCLKYAQSELNFGIGKDMYIISSDIRLIDKVIDEYNKEIITSSDNTIGLVQKKVTMPYFHNLDIYIILKMSHLRKSYIIRKPHLKLLLN